jgi:hypothetical protein
MTAQEIQDMITDLREVRTEITRINRAALETVFNPAATQALEAAIETLLNEQVSA